MANNDLQSEILKTLANDDPHLALEVAIISYNLLKRCARGLSLDVSIATDLLALHLGCPYQQARDLVETHRGRVVNGAPLVSQRDDPEARAALGELLRLLVDPELHRYRETACYAPPMPRGCVGAGEVSESLEEA